MTKTAARTTQEGTADLVRLPYGSDPAEVVRIVKRDGGVILTGMITRDEVAAINRELDAAFDFGSLDPIRTDKNGYVHAPPGAGLGVRVDWDVIEKASIAVFDQTRKGLSVKGT